MNPSRTRALVAFLKADHGPHLRASLAPLARLVAIVWLAGFAAGSLVHYLAAALLALQGGRVMAPSRSFGAFTPATPEQQAAFDAAFFFDQAEADPGPPETPGPSRAGNLWGAPPLPPGPAKPALLPRPNHVPHQNLAPRQERRR